MGELFRPRTVAEALDLLAEPAGGQLTLAAGCTDLFPATRAQALSGAVLDLTGIDGFRGITVGADGWCIGAGTTWSDIQTADLPPAFDGLKQAARQVGGVQIQNAGTVGGNLCNASPAADGVPPLLTLDAAVELQSVEGIRRLPLADFILGPRRTALRPDELLTAVLVPRASAAGRATFLKLGARAYLVVSITMVAARLVVTGGRIAGAALAVGSCGPVAVRMTTLEARLTGAPVREAIQRVTPDLVSPALSPISDVRADAAYRTDAAAELIRRALAGALV